MTQSFFDLHSFLAGTAVLVCVLVVMLFVARESFNRGKEKGLLQGHDELAACQQMAQVNRASWARAMEWQEEQHQEEMKTLQARIAGDARQFKKLSNQLQATTLTPTELQLVEDMANKLRLASSTLHATQQFAFARTAKELAHRGDLLLQRLLPRDAKGEAA